MLKHCDHKHNVTKIPNDEFWNSDIYYSIRACEISNLIIAIQNGENINETQEDTGLSYLHLLVENCEKKNEHKYLPMVYALSNGGIQVNKKDSKGKIALHLSVEKQLSEITTALIRVGSDLKQIDQQIQDNPVKSDVENILEKFNPGLWDAVEKDEITLVRKMIHSWCRINIKQEGKTLLQYAINNDKTSEIINLLDENEVTLEFVHATLAGDEKRMLEFLMDSKPCNPIVMDISYQKYWFQNTIPRSLKDTAVAMNLTHVLHLLPEEDEEIDKPNAKTSADEAITLDEIHLLNSFYSSDISSDTVLSISDVSVFNFFHPTQFPNKKSSSTESLSTDSHYDKSSKSYEKRYNFYENDSFGYKTERNPKNMYHKRYDKHKFVNLNVSPTDNITTHAKSDKSRMCIIS